MIRRSGIVAAVVYLFFVLPTFAHNGENHAHEPDTSTLWLGAVGVVVVAALVFSLVRHHDPPAGIDPGDFDDRRDDIR